MPAPSGYTGGPPTGISDKDNWEPLDKERTLEAVEWFEKELEASADADYLIVAGHYMIIEALGWYDLVCTLRFSLREIRKPTEIPNTKKFTNLKILTQK